MNKHYSSIVRSFSTKTSAVNHKRVHLCVSDKREVNRPHWKAEVSRALLLSPEVYLPQCQLQSSRAESEVDDTK